MSRAISSATTCRSANTRPSAAAQWDKGKGCDSFCPLGPWLVTRDEVPRPAEAGHVARRQRRAHADRLHQHDDLRRRPSRHYVSQFMTLLPGDIITTGTPPGVGMGKKPPRYLKAGDSVDARHRGTWPAIAEGRGMVRRRALSSLPLAAAFAAVLGQPAQADPLNKVSSIELGDVPGSITALTLDYANQRLFVLEGSAGRLFVVDLAASKVSQTIDGLRSTDGHGAGAHGEPSLHRYRRWQGRGLFGRAAGTGDRHCARAGSGRPAIRRQQRARLPALRRQEVRHPRCHS